MSHKPGTQLGGVRSIKMLMDRCRIDDITGCWNWTGAMTKEGYPKVQLPAGFDSDRSRVITAAKAAWILSGKHAPKGQMVYRAKCWNLACCNPAHLKCGTYRDMGRDAEKSGHLKGSPIRHAINRRNSESQSLPKEKVQQVQTMLQDGVSQREVAQIAAVSKDSVCKIAAGRHRHQNGRVCKQASVFAWASA